ncbi:MAG: hypothetical protein KA143_07390 [Saprospiraceae bacterium]|nr:hypothetical protein [Saprospiraceae bacterium]
MQFFVISGFLYGQQTFLAKVDSLKMEIGDQQNLTLTFTTSLGGNSPDFHLENLDTCSFFERVGQTEWIKTQSSTSTIIEKKIRFSVFDDGYYKIPTLYAVLGNDSIATYEIPIEITGVEPDSTGLLPIKGIVKEKNNWQDYLWWYVLLIALGLVYIVYRYMQKRKNQKLEDIIVPVEIIKSPHQIALEKLGTLKESRMWEKGEIKEYHSQLTYIIREYLENRFHIPALESTSLEILRDLKKHILESEMIKSVDDILNIADWVKFAKGIPEENANALALDRAIELVLFTKDDNEQSLQNKPAM